MIIPDTALAPYFSRLTVDCKGFLRSNFSYTNTVLSAASELGAAESRMALRDCYGRDSSRLLAESI